MTTPVFTSELTAKLIQSVGDDSSVVWAAKVSTDSDLVPASEAGTKGLINYLMKHSHGSPFEHNSMTFRIEAPIPVAREHMRHRVGWSYNEVSGRYTKFEPKFYVNSENRPLVQSGTSAHPDLSRPGGQLQHLINGEITAGALSDFARYERMIALGAANEVARTVLPVGIYTTYYVTCNARSLMAFLKLRVDSGDNTYETKPLWEIQQIADQMESQFKAIFPVTHAAFVANGRVAP